MPPGRSRSEVHAAVVILGGVRGREVHGPAPAQHVGDQCRMAALSIITGGGKWVEISIAADPFYQHLLLTAEKKFWRCVARNFCIASGFADRIKKRS